MGIVLGLKGGVSIYPIFSIFCLLTTFVIFIYLFLFIYLYFLYFFCLGEEDYFVNLSRVFSFLEAFSDLKTNRGKSLIVGWV